MKKGYVNGSDMLLFIDGKAVGHCTSHSVNCSAETKDHAVKPAASESPNAGLWKNKSVTSLSVSISAEGLCFYEETEGDYKTALSKWYVGQSVEVKCYERPEGGVSQESQPYLSGNFVITTLNRTDPAQDDATYSIELQSDGEVSFDPSKLTNESE